MADRLLSDGSPAPVEYLLAWYDWGRAFRFTAGDAVTQPAGGVLALAGSGNGARCNRMPRSSLGPCRMWVMTNAWHVVPGIHSP
jgi:hypothetical protein